MNNKLVSLNFTFRNTEATDPLKEYAEEKISNCLSKYIRQETKVNLVLEVEKRRQIAEITFNCFGTNFTCTEESDNMYKSIDAIVQTVGKQLRRYKDKVTSHTRG